MGVGRRAKRNSLRKGFRKFNKTWKALKRMDKKGNLSLGKRPTFAQWADHLEKMATQAAQADAETSEKPTVENLEWDDE